MGLFGKHTVLGKLLAPKPGGTTLGKLVSKAVGVIPVVGGVASSFFGNGATSPAAPAAPSFAAPSVAFTAPLVAVAEPMPVPASLSNTPMGAASIIEEPKAKTEAGKIIDTIFKGALGGAQTSATDVFLGTPAGKRAKAQGAMSFVKDNIAAFIAAGVALGVLLVMALRKK
jgi:uncharacterized membrane protein